MSAYVVDREHIVYMVEAATSLAISRYGASWYHNGEHHQLGRGDYEEMVRVANMLWRENVVSVQYRYDDCDPASLPEIIDEDYTITLHDFRSSFMQGFDPVQVIKSCHCYIYQTCEHPWWKESEVYAFIKSLEGHAMRSLPGYDDAEWGSPERKELVS